MKEFMVDKFLVRLMNHKDLQEVKQVQILRYNYLLKEYNQSLPDGGIDDDGYDKYTDSILVINTESGEICGTYRVATLKTTNGHKFLTEDEYDITPLKESGKDFVELGRAVVHPEYRTGLVIQLLFLGIYRYMIENNCQYTIGLCSFHGNDPTLYKNAFSYLKQNYSFKDLEIKACNNAFNLDMVSEIDEKKVDSELTGLLKMYLRFGNRVCFNGSIDYSFNSCDILIILDINEANMRYINHFTKMIKKEVA